MKGGSRAVDLNHLSMVSHASPLTPDSLAWWEYVPSASNAADGGNRTGHRDALARTLGVPLVQKVIPQFMLDIVRMGPLMTSNLPVRLGSCVLSVLRGEKPPAALGTPTGSEVSSPYGLS